MKQGAICSGIILALGIGALLIFGGRMSGAAVQAATQELIYGCLAIFGIVWTVSVVRQNRKK